MPLRIGLFRGVAKDAPSQEPYFPPSEQDGGWRVGDAGDLGVDVVARLLGFPFETTEGVAPEGVLLQP